MKKEEIIIYIIMFLMIMSAFYISSIRADKINNGEIILIRQNEE